VRDMIQRGHESVSFWLRGAGLSTNGSVEAGAQRLHEWVCGKQSRVGDGSVIR